MGEVNFLEIMTEIVEGFSWSPETTKAVMDAWVATCQTAYEYNDVVLPGMIDLDDRCLPRGTSTSIQLVAVWHSIVHQHGIMPSTADALMRVFFLTLIRDHSDDMADGGIPMGESGSLEIRYGRVVYAPRLA